MKTKLFITLLLTVLVGTVAMAAIIDFSDDDVVQYLTINQTQIPPPGVDLHFYLSTDGVTFTDMGVPPLGVEQVVYSNDATSGFVNDTLYVQHVPLNDDMEFWMFTRYEKYESDLDRTLYGASSDTVRIHIVIPAIPAGEAINIILDK